MQNTIELNPIFSKEDIITIQLYLIPDIFACRYQNNKTEKEKEWEKLKSNLFETCLIRKNFISYDIFLKEYVEKAEKIKINKKSLDDIYLLFTSMIYAFEWNIFSDCRQTNEFLWPYLSRNSSPTIRNRNPLYKKDLSSIKKNYDILKQYFVKYFSEDERFFKLKKSIIKGGDFQYIAEVISNDVSIRLLKDNRVIPSYILKTHTFSEDELIDIIKNTPDFKSKSAVMGGSQDKRSNASNWVLKTQTVTKKVLETILETGYPNEKEKFLRSMARRKITMKNLVNQDDSFILSLLDAGATFKFVDLSNATDSTKLLVEVNKT